MGTRIGVSDPLPVFRTGLRLALIQAAFTVDEPDDVVAWADADGSRSVLMSVASRSDWSVLDCLHERRPEAVVVALLHEPVRERYCEALARGAVSVLPRAATITEIVEVMRAAVEGRSLLPAEVLSDLARRHSRSPSERTSILSDEERGWMRGLAEGASVEDLAWRFGYSRRTMYRRLRVVYRRLGASRRDQALVAAIRRGMI